MIQRKILSNGMTVIFKQRKNGVVSVSFSVKSGGGNESAEEKGISHFVEHMLYKGTSLRTPRQISSEIEKNGGELNGFTSEQLTSFWCKMPSKKLDIALDVLSDIVKNPLFDLEDIEKERQVIFEEMKMHKDNPRLHVFDKIKNLLYKGDFSVSIIGTRESMKANNAEKLKDFFREVYVPENMVLSVVGDADFDNLCKFGEENFDKRRGKLKKVVAKTRRGEQTEKREGVDQANLILAYHIPNPAEKGYVASQVLNVLMAGGMSSRLFSEIREKRNLAYSVTGFIDGERDFAYAGVYVGTTAESVEKVKKLILDEYKKVSERLSAKELNQVKEQIIGNYLLAQEDSHNVMLDLLMSELKGNAQDVEKFVQKVRNVKLEDVMKMAAKVEGDYSFFALVPD